MLKMLRNLFITTHLQLEWDLHYGSHCYWKEQVYLIFGVHSMKEVLNVEPSIDHEEYYGEEVPEYFKKYTTINWINEHFNDMPDGLKQKAKVVAFEAAIIKAADVMCHPRARVGKFDWSDVIKLHEMLHTPYNTFIKEHEFSNPEDLLESSRLVTIHPANISHIKRSSTSSNEKASN